MIFDLDGTLADTVPDVSASVNQTLKRMGYAPLSSDQIRKAIGPAKDDFIRSIFPNEANPDGDGFLKAFREYYWEHCLDQTVLFPGMNTVLDAMDHLNLAVASNKPRRFIEKILKGLNVFDRFEVIASPDDVAEAKPNPEMILNILSTLKTPPEETLMVGDTDKDILAARSAGVRVCGVRYGYGSLESLIPLHPDFWIDSPLELLPLINNHNTIR